MTSFTEHLEAIGKRLAESKKKMWIGSSQQAVEDIDFLLAWVGRVQSLLEWLVDWEDGEYLDQDLGAGTRKNVIPIARALLK